MQDKPLSMSFKCDQNPYSFKKGETGFCMRCQKEVHDFSDVPASEIRNMIRQHKGTLCGRIYADQLEERAPASSGSRWLRMIACAGLGLLLLGANRAQAQKRDSVNTEQHPQVSEKSIQKQEAIPAASDSAAIEADAEIPADKAKSRKKRFMTIGQYNYYVQARFPFLSIRRQRVMIAGSF